MTTVLKLGGSVLTVKDEPETVDRANLARAAAAVGDRAGTAAGESGTLVLVHGGGSFGHHHADRLDISRTAGTSDATAVRETHDAMTRLDGAVLDALGKRGVPAVPVRPLSAAHRDADGELHLQADQVLTMVDEGFVPVLHGDVVAHAGRGATVLSGDELVVTLARALDADRVGLCAGVPGILDADGDIVDRITSFGDVAGVLADDDTTDVTGGMAGKVRALLALETPASVFGLDGLEPFLAGETPGTRIG